MAHDLQQTRYDQLIRRVGGIIGPGSKVGEALEELFPVIDVERVPGELLLLSGTRVCLGSFSLTSDALERPRVQLFNPVGSGNLVTVSTVIIFSIQTITVNYTVNNIALTDGQGTERFRDFRLGGIARPTTQIRSDSLVATTDAIGHMRISGSEPEYLNDENGVAVLSPGSGLEIGGTGIQTFVGATFFWRERTALESELLFR